jgi:hypothetical protein
MADQTVAALVCLVARDVLESNALERVPAGLQDLASRSAGLPEIYDAPSASALRLVAHEPAIRLFEQLVTCGVADLDTYFYSLAELHKRRMRYETILSGQSFPRIEQVGPRAMLQYGQADPAALAVLLTWRKWIYDIDNRAAQETGYVFEPALTGALGGASFPASSSPIRKLGDSSKGRQVDCLIETPNGKWAYEFKIRVTIAASGQGRWNEELTFPLEAQAAGFVPVLVVFDSTPNEKLSQLCTEFRSAGGETYTGDAAWHHIEERSGAIMGHFVNKYLRGPLIDLLGHEPDSRSLPPIEFSMGAHTVRVSIGGSPSMVIERIPDSVQVADDVLDLGL